MVTNFRKKQKANPLKKLLVGGGALLILALSVGLVVANVKIFIKKRQLAVQVRELEAKTEQMRQRNVQLQEGIANADNSEYIEKVAREELDLQKPGEKVFSFVVKPDENPQNPEKAPSAWQVWLGWLSGWFTK